VHPPPNELPLDWLYLSSFQDAWTGSCAARLKSILATKKGEKAEKKQKKKGKKQKVKRN
jgi:hypothetical protein